MNDNNNNESSAAAKEKGEAIAVCTPIPPLKHSSTRVFYTFLRTYSRIEKVDTPKSA